MAFKEYTPGIYWSGLIYLGILAWAMAITGILVHIAARRL